jgi:hypothetical protein
MDELKLLITIPPNADSDAFDFQNMIIRHLESGLNLEAEGEGKWGSRVGITMEVVK